MTYPIYLLHFTLGMSIIFALSEFAGMATWIAFIIAAAAIVVLSWLVSRYFEPMASRWLKDKIRRVTLVAAGRIAWLRDDRQTL